MDIGAAEATIDLLYRNGLVRDMADLYDLTYDDVVELDRFADVSARKLIASIDASRLVPFERVLYALGIRYVGETMARKLARHFGSLEKLEKAGREDLLQAEETGERIAESIMEYFAHPVNRELIGRLKAAGIKFRAEVAAENTEQFLKGLSFVISGTFSDHTREELRELIEKHGGRNAGSVSSKTDYLLAGEQPGPSKIEKAERLRIRIIGEEDFMELLKKSD